MRPNTDEMINGSSCWENDFTLAKKGGEHLL